MSSHTWNLTLRAISYSVGPQPDHRSAVTKDDLIKLVAVRDTDPSLVPLRVALVFGFLGYLRISNLAPPTAKSFDPARVDVKPSKEGILQDLKWTKTLQTGVPLKHINLDIPCGRHIPVPASGIPDTRGPRLCDGHVVVSQPCCHIPSMMPCPGRDAVMPCPGRDAVMPCPTRDAMSRLRVVSSSRCSRSSSRVLGLHPVSRTFILCPGSSSNVSGCNPMPGSSSHVSGCDPVSRSNA